MPMLQQRYKTTTTGYNISQAFEKRAFEKRAPDPSGSAGQNLPTYRDELVAIYLLRNGGIPFMGYIGMCRGIGLAVFEVLDALDFVHISKKCI